MNDAKAVCKVFSGLKVPKCDILDLSIPIEAAFTTTQGKIQLRKEVKSLQQKFGESGHSVLSDRIALKMSKAGLTFNSLMLAYTRDHEHGISAILSEKIDGKSRVTNRTRIIDSLTQVCADKYKNSSGET